MSIVGHFLSRRLKKKADKVKILEEQSFKEREIRKDFVNVVNLSLCELSSVFNENEFIHGAGALNLKVYVGQMDHSAVYISRMITPWLSREEMSKALDKIRVETERYIEKNLHDTYFFRDIQRRGGMSQGPGSRSKFINY